MFQGRFVQAVEKQLKPILCYLEVCFDLMRISHPVTENTSCRQSAGRVTGKQRIEQRRRKWAEESKPDGPICWQEQNLIIIVMFLSSGDELQIVTSVLVKDTERRVSPCKLTTHYNGRESNPGPSTKTPAPEKTFQVFRIFFCTASLWDTRNPSHWSDL